jgi:hypothetical protein
MVMSKTVEKRRMKEMQIEGQRRVLVLRGKQTLKAGFV